MIHRTKNVDFFVEEPSLLDAALPLQPLNSVRLTLTLIIFVGDDTDGGKSSLANLSVNRLAVESPHRRTEQVRLWSPDLRMPGRPTQASVLG